ncbi:MAG: tetratricopeptide repeat protein, partial [Planctomycetes bacterium]|nr:tetratricopeptide repeat protein [Planctomycetota bacterium]
TRWQEAQDREFDFSQDYTLLNTLAGALFERARSVRGDARREERDGFLARAATTYKRVLELDPENATAHYGLSQVYTSQGQEEDAEAARALHERYRVDDNARDRAVVAARRMDPAADHAANAVVIYDLQRERVNDRG